MGMQDRRVAARKRAEQGIFFPWDKGHGRRQRKAKTGGWILKLTSEGDTAIQGPGAQRSGTRGSEVSQAEASRSQLSLRLRPPEEFKALMSMGLESELGPERQPASSASETPQLQLAEGRRLRWPGGLSQRCQVHAWVHSSPSLEAGPGEALCLAQKKSPALPRTAPQRTGVAVSSQGPLAGVGQGQSPPLTNRARMRTPWENQEGRLFRPSERRAGGLVESPSQEGAVPLRGGVDLHRGLGPKNRPIKVRGSRRGPLVMLCSAHQPSAQAPGSASSGPRAT